MRKLAEDDHQPITTLTAMVWSGSQATLVHIGDGRAYLLRGGELSQLTQDHTYVQPLVDQGKLAPDQAACHPERVTWGSLASGGRPGVARGPGSGVGLRLDRVEIAGGVALVLPLLLEDHVQAGEGGLLVFGVPRVLARRGQVV